MAKDIILKDYFIVILRTKKLNQYANLITFILFKEFSKTLFSQAIII